MSEADRTVTCADVAELYGCSPNLVEELVADGLIKAESDNGRKRILLRELNQQLRQVDRLRISGTVLPIRVPRRRVAAAVRLVA